MLNVQYSKRKMSTFIGMCGFNGCYIVIAVWWLSFGLQMQSHEIIIKTNFLVQIGREQGIQTTGWAPVLLFVFFVLVQFAPKSLIMIRTEFQVRPFRYACGRTSRHHRQVVVVIRQTFSSTRGESRTSGYIGATFSWRPRIESARN